MGRGRAKPVLGVQGLPNCSCAQSATACAGLAGAGLGLVLSPVTAGDGLHMLCGQRRRTGSFTSTLGQSQTVLPAQGSAGSSWLCGTTPASTPWPPCSTLQDTHLDYVLAAAELFAQVHRVPPCRDRAAIQAILRDVVLPPFSPQEGLQIPLIEEPAEEAQVPTGEVP